MKKPTAMIHHLEFRNGKRIIFQEPHFAPEVERWSDLIAEHRGALHEWLDNRALSRDVKISVLIEVLAFELSQSEASTVQGFLEEIRRACEIIASEAESDRLRWVGADDDDGDGGDAA